MAPTASSSPVGVDVTAHKEARHITDVKRARRQSNTRVRYYVELVVGSPRGDHTRLGFSGTFKALLRLHGAFEALFNAKHAPLKDAHAHARESVSSATSVSSSASSSASQRRRGSVESDAAATTPKILPFPTHHALLVKLQPRQHVESDAKASARCDALFAYYSQLFNSDERELYVEYIQNRAEKAQTATGADNQQDHAAEEAAVTSEKRGFLKKLFGLRRHAQDDSEGAERTGAAASSGRARAAALDAKLEFAAPVHVTAKKSRRRGGT